MSQIFHVLNGDALKEQFPDEVEGTRVVFRECLVEGPVQATSSMEFYQLRSDFLETNYPIKDLPSYHDFVVPELERVVAIPDGSEVQLWFEDDLFCQVNLWFCIHLLMDKEVRLNLVRPDQLSPYGFAAYSAEALVALYERKVLLHKKELWGRLWESYQLNDLESLVENADSLAEYPFVGGAVQAHIDRFPPKGHWGRPERTLIEIIGALETNSFGPVFREFTRREAIYGFGDLQVKRLFDKVIGSET